MPAVMSLEQYKCSTVQRNELIGVPMPEATKSYQPVPHSWLLDNVEDALNDAGFGFGKDHHGLSHDGARYFGLIEVVGKDTHGDGYHTLLGLRNSLDKRFGAQIAIGNQVMVCANLCFGGEYMLGRKHTPNIMRDIPDLVRELLSAIPTMNQQAHDRFDVYRETNLTISDADHAIIEMYRQGAINTARIEKVVHEWDNPSYDHGGDRSVWRLFNAATQALKGVNIHEMPQRTIRLQGVCDDLVGMKVAA